MTLMMQGGIDFYRVRETADDVVLLDPTHTLLQVILDRNDQDVVDADSDVLCNACALRVTAEVAGAAQTTLRVSHTSLEAAGTPDVVLRVTGTDGSDYVATYEYGRTDETTSPCARCGGETLFPDYSSLT